MSLGYPRSGTVLGFRGPVTGSISAFFTLRYGAYNSKTNDCKVFKLGVGNDLRISYK